MDITKSTNLKLKEHTGWATDKQTQVRLSEHEDNMIQI